MDQQITQAVEIALSGSADANLKNQAYQFINEIKSTDEGYKSCLEILMKNSANKTLNGNLKFFIYQVIDEYIPKLNNEQLFELNTQLLKVMGDYILNGIDDQSYLKNKLSTVFGKVFCSAYMNVNPNFLKDLTNLIQNKDVIALDYYTRILLAIHSEIGDRFITRDKDGQDKIGILKDQIRALDMDTLVDTWFNILIESHGSSVVLNNVLKIIGFYSNWMELNLFVSTNYINVLFQYFKQPENRNECCNTLVEFISKKMKPDNKLQLMSLLDLTSLIQSSVNPADNDLEFLENVSKLLNQIGLEIITALETQSELFGNAMPQLLKLWPLVFEYISHEYDDVSLQVFAFIQSYLLLCKKDTNLYSVELLSTLLNKVILKMKIDDDDNGLDDDTLEEFNDVRAKLKTFQDTIAILKPDLYLEAIPIVINESIFSLEASGENTDWRKLELGLYELSNFSDSLKNNLLNLPKEKVNNSEPYLLLQDFLVKLINSNFVLNVNHPKVQLGVFEIIVKDVSYLKDAQIANRILNIFTSPLGLLNSLDQVRLRSCYLFFRYIKLTKISLDNATLMENVFVKISPLLVVKAELPTKDEDEDLVDNENFNSQLYLFESLGLLLSVSSIDDSLKLKLIDVILEPIFKTLEECIKAINSGENSQLVALQAHHALMAIGTFARGYDADSHSNYSPDIINKINNAASVVLITLGNFSKFDIVREASRFSFARFIPILGVGINSHLSKLVSLTLAANNLKVTELNDFLGFLGQVVHRFNKDDNIYQLLNDLLTPLLNKVDELLTSSSGDEQLIPDLIRDKNSLKKAYMSFIGAIITNNASSLLITQTNKQKFPEVLNNLFTYAYDLSDTSVSRLAIIQLGNIVNVFGNGGKITDSEDKFSETITPIEGIDGFLMDKVVHLSFELPFQKSEFDLMDAQFRLIGQEISILLQIYRQRKGDEYLNYLSNYLTTMGLSQELMNEFGTNLVGLDRRAFKKYFITFVTQLKGGK